MMLYRKFLQIYIVIFESIIVKYFRWFLMIQTAIKTHVLWWAGTCHLCIVLQKEWSLWCYGGVNWLLSFKGVINHHSIGYCMCVNLSLTTEVLCISVFPEFWKYLPMILVQELLHLLLTLTLCLCRYMLYMPAMILARYCRLLGLAITSVDGCCLYIIIHNCILHGTWL